MSPEQLKLVGARIEQVIDLCSYAPELGDKEAAALTLATGLFTVGIGLIRATNQPPSAALMSFMKALQGAEQMTKQVEAASLAAEKAGVS